MKVPIISNLGKAIMTILVIMAMAACAPVVRSPAPLFESGKPSLTAPVGEYRVQAGDQLDVKFFYNPELNELVTVRPDGRISLQLAPEVIAAGVTPAELTEQLRRKYSTVIENPEIAVLVRTFSAHRVYIDGEVVRPGIVMLTNDMSVMQAVSQAGGFKDTARKDEVIIMRRSVDGKIVSSVVNADMIIDGTDMKQDIALLTQDVVYVPKSAIADVNVWVDQYLRRNIPIPLGMGYTIP